MITIITGRPQCQKLDNGYNNNSKTPQGQIDNDSEENSETKQQQCDNDYNNNTATMMTITQQR